MKVKVIVLLMFSFGIALTFSSFSCAANLDDIIKGLEESEKTTEDIHLEFIQSINFVTMKETHTITGELFFKKPGKMHYAIKSPNQQIFVSDGKRLWIYTPANNQVLMDFWKNWKGISYFIPGMYNPKGKVTDLKKFYEFNLKSEDENNYVLHLKPKQKVATALNLPETFDFYLWVSKKNYHPLKSRFESNEIVGDTEILIYEYNLKLPDEKFKFKVPEGAEVLKLFK